MHVNPVEGLSTTWCATESWFANVTASPVTIASVFGTYPFFVIAIVVVAAGADEATAAQRTASTTTESFFITCETPRDELRL